MFRSIELPFVPTILAIFMFCISAYGFVLDASMSPTDARRELESLGGDLNGSELHLYYAMPPSQKEYMLHLARLANNGDAKFAEINSPRRRLSSSTP